MIDRGDPKDIPGGSGETQQIALHDLGAVAAGRGRGLGIFHQRAADCDGGDRLS